MHKGFVAGVLGFWIVICSLFLHHIVIFASVHHVDLYEAFKMFDMETQDKLMGYGIITPILFVIIYTIRPLLFFPASVMTITSVFVFGPYEGFFVSYIGEMFSAILAYYVGKYFGEELGITRKILKTPIGPYFQGNPFLSIFVLRIVPLFPFDFVNYASGVFKIRFKKYLLATLLGVIPGLAVFIFLGNSLVHREFLPVAIASVVALILGGLWAKERYEVKV
jgi:uncharacterized membrane protein YdjX (TVP38/TMEM64 family)